MLHRDRRAICRRRRARYGCSLRVLLDPVALPGERIGRQRNPARHGIAIQPPPVKRKPLGPQLEQLAVLALLNPRCDDLRHVLGRKDRKRIPLASNLAEVELFDSALTRQKATKLRHELRHRGRRQRKPALHRLAAYLQRVGHIGKIIVGERTSLDISSQLLNLSFQSLPVLRRQHNQRRS